jgi:hypothetical protein
MESLDLNIDNYNLPDILALFNLPTLFNENDLKRAKLTVLKTHPDKSQLPKEYFLFFTKAYRIVHQIYTIRHPTINEHYTQRVERTPRISSASVVPSIAPRCVSKDTLREPYTPIDGGVAAANAAKDIVDYDRLMQGEGYRYRTDDEYSQASHERMKRHLDEMMNNGKGEGGGGNTDSTTTTKVSEFNRWFNEKFEQYRLKDDELETGYEAWLRGETDDDTNPEQNTDDSGSWADKVARLNQRKQELRNKYALVERQELEYAGGFENGSAGGGYDLTRERPQEYSSGIFGNLRYEDLKKAHTETVIPVTEEDYYKTKRFNTVNELQTFRDQSRRDLYKQTSKAEQEHIYQQSRMRQEEEDTRRAFILAKQDEISRDIHKKLYSDMFRLEN